MDDRVYTLLELADGKDKQVAQVLQGKPGVVVVDVLEGPPDVIMVRTSPSLSLVSGINWLS